MMCARFDFATRMCDAQHTNRNGPTEANAISALCVFSFFVLFISPIHRDRCNVARIVASLHVTESMTIFVSFPIHTFCDCIVSISNEIAHRNFGVIWIGSKGWNFRMLFFFFQIHIAVWRTGETDRPSARLRGLSAHRPWDRHSDKAKHSYAQSTRATSTFFSTRSQ